MNGRDSQNVQPSACWTASWLWIDLLDMDPRIKIGSHPAPEIGHRNNGSPGRHRDRGS
jgi:hypothetical protein